MQKRENRHQTNKISDFRRTRVAANADQPPQKLKSTEDPMCAKDIEQLRGGPEAEPTLLELCSLQANVNNLQEEVDNLNAQESIPKAMLSHRVRKLVGIWEIKKVSQNRKCWICRSVFTDNLKNRASQKPGSTSKIRGSGNSKRSSSKIPRNGG